MEKKISLSSGVYLLVKTEKDWSDFEFNESDKNVLMFCTRKDIRHINIPDGDWDILGSIKDLKENDLLNILFPIVDPFIPPRNQLSKIISGHGFDPAASIILKQVYLPQQAG